MNPLGAIGAVGPAGVSGVLPAGNAFAAGAAGDAAQGPGAVGNFAAAMTQGLDKVQSLQSSADTLAVKAATGDLTDVHAYRIAATQSQLATELTVAVRNKAVDAFTEIMRMQA